VPGGSSWGGGAGSMSGPSWAGPGSSGNLVAGQPGFGSGGGVASGVNGAGFGGGTSSLVSEAPQGSIVVNGGSSMGGSVASTVSSTGAEGSGASMVSGASTASGGANSAVSGLPPGAWSGAKRDDPGYAPWVYGSHFSPSEQSRGGVDLFSGSRLAKPDYPALPAMLRFRYIGAPLWWTAATGSWAAGTDDSDSAVGANSVARSLRSGLTAANSAAAIWRSIFVAPGRQDFAGPGGSSGSDAGTIDHTWDRNADDMASLSSRMALIAVGVGGGAGAAVASGAGGALAGPETVYVAMDSAGRAGTTTGSGARPSMSPTELSMKIVAAIPPSPPPLADMAAASSTNAEVRPRQTKAGAGAHHDDEKSGDQGVSRSKIEGSVDAIAQRIYHRIVRRLDSDRERFGG
jgi:hypothetical protein